MMRMVRPSPVAPWPAAYEVRKNLVRMALSELAVPVAEAVLGAMCRPVADEPVVEVPVASRGAM